MNHQAAMLVGSGAPSQQGLDEEEMKTLDTAYEHILSQLVTMIDSPKKWLIHPKK
jgi:hypothetical protein